MRRKSFSGDLGGQDGACYGQAFFWGRGEKRVVRNPSRPLKGASPHYPVMPTYGAVHECRKHSRLFSVANIRENLALGTLRFAKPFACALPLIEIMNRFSGAGEL